MKKNRFIFGILFILLLNACAVQRNDGDVINMNYDFTQFKNVDIIGVQLDSLNEEELSVLYTQAEYCEAMCDADIEKLKKIVSEDTIFTHMSGKTQTRDEYFKDIETGRLDYHYIGIDHPEIMIDGDNAYITFTSVLKANAYGAEGTYRMKGTHCYSRIDNVWYAVKRK